MSRREYFEVLKETSKVVTPFVFQYLEREDFQEPTKSFVEVLPKRRAKNPRLRDLLLRLSYEVCEGKDWERVIPPYAAAIELYNDSTYIINWFLDGKGELQTKDDEKCAVNAGFLLRELAQRIIQEQDAIKETTLEIICGLSDVNSRIYRAQNIDLFGLTVDNFDQVRDEREFLEIYYKKGRLICGDFLAWIADVGAILTNGREEYGRILRDFATDVGTGLQLTNDAGDFVPPNKRVKTVDKSYKDQVTDIANGRLTLPIWYCLKHGTDKQKGVLLNLVGRRDATIEEQERAVYAVRDSGAFNFIISEANRTEKRSRETLHQLPKSRARDLLSTMASVIRTNKFFVTLRDEYGVRGDYSVSEA